MFIILVLLNHVAINDYYNTKDYNVNKVNLICKYSL